MLHSVAVDFTAATFCACFFMSFCLYYYISMHVFMCLDACMSVSVQEKRRGGNKLFRVQLSVRISRQKVDDDSQREEAAFCSPSVVSSEISSMWQKEMVDILTSRQQLKGAQLPVTHSKHTAFTRLLGWKWFPCEQKKTKQKEQWKNAVAFSTLKVKVITHDSFI